MNITNHLIWHPTFAWTSQSQKCDCFSSQISGPSASMFPFLFLNLAQILQPCTQSSELPKSRFFANPFLCNNGCFQEAIICFDRSFQSSTNPKASTFSSFTHQHYDHCGTRASALRGGHNCETQRFTDQKLSSPIFACCLFVRLSVCSDRWHLHLSQLYDVLDHKNHTWCMCGGTWLCLDHVWWCLVVSGGVWSSPGDVNGYRLTWPELMYMGRYLFQCL